MKKLLIHILTALVALCMQVSCEQPDTGCLEPGTTIPPLDDQRLPGGWPEKVVPNLNGVAVHTHTFIDFSSYWNSAAMNQLQAAGIKFARIAAPWHDVERTKGVYSFEPAPFYPPGYDNVFHAFFDRGIRPVICVGFGNSLYGQSQTTPITSEAGIAAFAAYCKAYMKAYRDYDPVFEIWNEPHLPGFGLWPAEDYIRFFKACKAAIREGWAEGRDVSGLTEPLVIGPVASGTWGRGNWFDKCLDAGITDVVDALCFHPYSDGNQNPARRIPEIVPENVELLRNELERRGIPRDFPLVFTEWGWCTATASENRDWWVTYEEQAKMHVRQMILAYYMDIEINCIYSMADARNEDQRASEASKHYGMFETSGDNFNKMLKAKPSVAAVTEFTEALRGMGYIERVDMGSNSAGLLSYEDWCLVFRNPATGEAKIAIWTTKKNTTKVSPDLKPLLGLSESITTEFTDMPRYIDIEGYKHPRN